MEQRCYGCMRITGGADQCAHCGYRKADQNAPHQLSTGTILQNQYLVGKVLGQGGFGITYLGWDLQLKSPVAIKEYFPSSLVNRTHDTVMLAVNEVAFQEGKDRFLKEAQALAKLRRIPNVVQVHSFFSENNTVYIVMEYIEGITLQDHIRRNGGPLPPEETLSILHPIIQSMAQVHDSGMIHRDISPDNIMIQTDGTVKILDFGTARAISEGQLTHSTQAVLKTGFAPMEQYSEGRAIDHRADEYALGATIYYCLTCRVPPSAFDRYMDSRPIPWDQIPGLSAAHRKVLETCTAMRPEDRFPDLNALEQALFSDPENGPSAVSAGEVPSKKPKFRWTILAAGILALLLGACGWLTYQRNLSRQTAISLEKTAQATHPRLIEPAQTTPPATQPTEPEPENPSIHVQIFDSGSNHTVALSADGTVLVTNSDPVQNWTDIVSVSAGHNHTLGLKADGSVVAAGDNTYAQCEVSVWRDIVAVSGGQRHSVGLKSDGTVVAVGSGHDFFGLSQWTNITAIDAGWGHTVGLRSNGTVVASGSDDYGQCNISQWEDIIAISTGWNHTVGLRSDGTVVATGFNRDQQCNMSWWSDIVAVAAGFYHTVGLKSDGTVVAVGNHNCGVHEVSGWTDIVAIAAGEQCILGLKSDGTLVYAGEGPSGQFDVDGWALALPEGVETDPGIPELAIQVQPIAAGGNHTVGLRRDGTVVVVGYNSHGQCDVTKWRDIVSVAAGGWHTVGLKADGTAVAVGGNPDGRCDVEDWTGLAAIAAGYNHTVGLKTNGTVVTTMEVMYFEGNVSIWRNITAITAGGMHTVGLQSDGRVVASGSDDHGQCQVSSWADITAIAAGYNHTVGLKANGTVVAVGRNDLGQCEVSSWTDIVAIAAGWDHTLGLKSDGTVVAVGLNDSGQCEVSKWRNIVAISASNGFTVGLRKDGSVAVTGENDSGACRVTGWHLQVPRSE